MRLRTLAIACVVASLGARRRLGVTAIRPGTTSETDRCTPRSPIRPSQAVELRLLGVLQAARRDGYPDQGGARGRRGRRHRRAGDAPAPAALRGPARRRPGVRAAGHGPGARGHAARPRGGGARDGGDGLRTRHAGEPPALLGALARRRPADGDALAQTAIAAVRRVARVGGHAAAGRRPARTNLLAPGPSRAGGGGGSTPGWLPLAVFAAVFLLAWLAYELRIRAPRRRRLPSSPRRSPCPTSVRWSSSSSSSSPS